jgi:hypothetical protein
VTFSILVKKLVIEMNNRFLLLLLVLLFQSCSDSKKEATSNSNTVLVKKDILIEIPDTFGIDMSTFGKDSCFVQNNATFCVYHDTVEKSYNQHAFVELIKGNTKEKILVFNFREEFLYSFIDLNDDGYRDLHIYGDPLRQQPFYLFNPRINRFKEVGSFNFIWSKIDKDLYCDHVDVYSDDSDFNSRLFAIKDYKIEVLAFVSRERLENDDILLKVIKLNGKERVWEELIPNELIVKHTTGKYESGEDKINIEGLMKEIWHTYKDKFRN